MAVLFTRAQLDQQKATLDKVRSVGQAWAAIGETQKLANTVASEIHQAVWEDSWRTIAIKQIRAYQASLTREAKALEGAAPTASAVQAWKSIRTVVSNLWFHALSVQQQFPANETTAMQRLSGKISSAADALRYGIEQAPDVILDLAKASSAQQQKVVKKVVAGTARAAGDAAKTALDTAGAAAGGILGPLKWWLLGGAALAIVVGVVYVSVLRKVG
jgi:hypothetical protein